MPRILFRLALLIIALLVGMGVGALFDSLTAMFVVVLIVFLILDWLFD